MNNPIINDTVTFHNPSIGPRGAILSGTVTDCYVNRSSVQWEIDGSEILMRHHILTINGKPAQ